MINIRALLLASVLGIVLQVAMVVAGHYNKSIAGLFAIGGMCFSLIAGLAYARFLFPAVGAAAVLVVLVGAPSVAHARTTRSVACRTSIGVQGHIVRPGAPSVAMILSGMPAAQDTSPIVSEVVIEAPVDEVWKAWATSDGLRSWLAPHAEIDMRVGGRMRTNYSAQGTLGDSQTIENTILSLDPRRMLSIRVSRAPNGLPFANALQNMWTVIYFEPVGPDRTRVRVVGLGFRPDAESQQMRGFFDQGNAATLKLLQRHFAAKPC